VGITPIQEPRVSPVELVVDSIISALWIISASVQAANGSCPRYLFRVGNSAESILYDRLSPAEKLKLLTVDCLPWNLSWSFGFGLGIAFAMGAYFGYRIYRQQLKAERVQGTLTARVPSLMFM
jgi:hypothetical protein